MSLAFGTTPASRQPGGPPDPVMRNIGAVTTNIRLTPTAATVAGGSGYILGKVSDLACGSYEISWQAAASATAEALGAKNFIIADVIENTAGVFITYLRQINDAAGTITAGDHSVTNRALADVNIDGVGDLATAGDLEFAVATSTGVTNSADVTDGTMAGLAVGDLYLFDSIAATTRVYTIRRLG